MENTHHAISPVEQVTQFIRTLEQNDKTAILAAFHPDAIFHNMPMAPAQGYDAIWAALAPLHDTCTGIDWQILNIAETIDGKVLTERLDRYQVNGKWCEFPVMGIFELAEGKIQYWRDYFDLNQVLAQLA